MFEAILRLNHILNGGLDPDANAEMVGKVIVKASPATKGDHALQFEMSDGTTYVFYHRQECSESVEIEDVCGDMADLIGSPLIQAEKVSSTDPHPVDPFAGVQCTLEYPDSQTWTFYKFATIKGSVTVRWFGQSNGYYSEGVDLEVFQPGQTIPPDLFTHWRHEDDC